MTFNAWLIQEYGQNWQGIHMDQVVEGLSEDELNEKHDELRGKFEEYMEVHELEETPE